MLKLAIILYFVSLFSVGYWCVEFRQERAKLTYWNPKYLANATMLTRRVSRHEPYRTNLTSNILVPFGNNVTFALILRLKSGGDFTVQSKVCECMKSKWMKEYMQQFTNLTLDNCPFPPGRYAYINMELPPKNVPIPVMNGDYYIIMELFVTATKEKILVASTLLKFDPGNNKKANGKKDNTKDKKG